MRKDERHYERSAFGPDEAGERTPIAIALATALAACIESSAAISERTGRSDDLYTSDAIRIRLRDCVRDYSVMMRLAGAPPERVLKAVKAILHDAAPGVESYSALATDVSRWCIEAYFETD